MLEEGMFICDGKDLTLYQDELLKQPIRLLIQLLQQYYRPSTNVASEQRLNQALRSAMLSSIYKTGLTYDISEANVGTLCKDIFRFINLDGDTNTGYYLRPHSEQESIRNSAIYLASQVSRLCTNKLAATLHLLLVGCGSVSLYDKVQKLVDRQDNLEQVFVQYLGLGRNESVSHWANRSCSALCPIDDDMKLGVHPGLLRLNQRTPDRSKDSFEAYKAMTEKNYLAQITVNIATSYVQGKKVHGFLSLFNLLGGISDLLNEWNSIEETTKDTTKLAELLSKLAANTTCTPPKWNTTDKPEREEEDDQGEIVRLQLVK